MNGFLKGWPRSPLHPALLLATWFYSGLLPGAPGTWGSLAALPFAWGLLALGGPAGLAAGILLSFLLGLWAAGRYMRQTGKQDPGEVVIDEVAGVWIACLPLSATAGLANYVLAFALFRFFDILKPWPIRIFDRRHSAFGVMMDDVVAGLMAAIVLWGIRLYV